MEVLGIACSNTEGLHIQGDTSGCDERPVDSKTKDPLWPGQARKDQAKTELLFWSHVEVCHNLMCNPVLSTSKRQKLSCVIPRFGCSLLFWASSRNLWRAFMSIDVCNQTPCRLFHSIYRLISGSIQSLRVLPWRLPSKAVSIRRNTVFYSIPFTKHSTLCSHFWAL